MTSLEMNQNFYLLFLSRIRYQLRRIDISKSFEEILKECSTILFSDPYSQPYLKKIISNEMVKLKRSSNGGGQRDLTRMLRLRIKKILRWGIKKELFKLNSYSPVISVCSDDRNDHVSVIDVDSSESKQLTIRDSASQKNKSYPEKHEKAEKEGETNCKAILSCLEQQNKEIKRAVNSPEEKQILRNNRFLLKPETTLEDAFCLKKTSEFGHFLYGDKINRVLDWKWIGPSLDQQTVLIEWKKRKNGKIPSTSMFSMLEFMTFRPAEAKIFLQQQLGTQNGSID